MIMYDNMKFYGRGTQPDEKGRIPLFWSGSGFEFDTDADEAYMTVVSDFNTHEMWFAIWLDGVCISRRMASKGRERVCLFRGKMESRSTRVRVTKETQPMPEDSCSYIYVESVECSGAMNKMPEKNYCIEVIGDSITSGEGTYGARKAMEWISSYFSYERTYERLLGDILDAEISVVSSSGWGVVAAWDNNCLNRIPRIYDKICQNAAGEINISFGADKDYDFIKSMDIIIISLGTNDAGGFDNPEWTSEDGMLKFKNHRNYDGTLFSGDTERFSRGAEEFIGHVHEKNPDAYILWIYGQLGDILSPFIRKAVDSFKQKTGFKRADFLQLPGITYESEGSREHPGAASHDECARLIAETIANKKILI